MKRKIIKILLINLIIIAVLGICVVLRNPTVQHEKILSDNNKTEKMEESSYEEITCEIGSSSNNSDTTFLQNVSGIDANTAIQINAPQKDYAQFTYAYQNLNPRDFYSISAYVKVNSIDLPNSDGEYGVNIVRFGTPAASETIKQVTTQWKKITLVAMSDTDGDLDVCFRLNQGSGNVLFDKIEIKQISDNEEFKLYTYTNTEGKVGRVVFYKSNIDGTGITKNEIEKWLENLLKLRKCLTNLTGKEFDDGNVDIIATNHYGAVAYVIGGKTEIQWMKDSINLQDIHEKFQNGLDTPFFITHEMGHQHTDEQINFNSEDLGTALGLLGDYYLNFKIDFDGITQGQSIIDSCYNCYNRYFSEGRYVDQGVIYKIFQTILQLNSQSDNLGWTSLEQTFKYIRQTETLSKKGEKFELFIIKWSEFSGYDVKSIFYNSTNDIKVLEEEFKIGKFEYTVNEDNKTATINGYTRNWEEMKNDTYTLSIPSIIEDNNKRYTVTAIKEWAFANNKIIKEVNIPDSVINIGQWAFYNCTSLTKIKLPNNIAQISYCLFYKCNNLEEIYIPNSVTNIEGWALAGCSENLKIIGKENTYAQTYANQNNIQFINSEITINVNGGKAYKANTSVENYKLYDYAKSTIAYSCENKNDDRIIYLNNIDNYYLYKKGYHINNIMWEDTNGGTGTHLATSTVETVTGVTEENSSSPINIQAKKWDLDIGIDMAGQQFMVEWQANQYTVTLNANGGKLDEGNTTRIVSYNSEYGQLPTPKREEHIFEGWYLDEALTQKVETQTIVKATNDHTLYANWIPIYTITLDNNGGTGGTTNIYQKYGIGVYLDEACSNDKQMSITSNPIIKPENQYYTFEGYYLEDKQLIDSNGNISQEWLENPKITGNDNNIALQAHWKGNIYTVNLELNGGNSSVSNISVEYNEIYETNTILVDKPGHNFDGWYLDKDCTIKIENDTKCTTPAEHTIYANWIPKTVEIAFEYNDGSQISSHDTIFRQYNQLYGTLPEPKQEGYNLEGWYLDKDFANKIENDTKCTKEVDHTIYANWIPKNIEIGFEYNDGSQINSHDTIFRQYNQTYGTLPEPKQEGYTFDGWYLDEDCTTKIENDTKCITEVDHTIYAKWEPIIYTITLDNNGGNGGTTSIYQKYGIGVYLDETCSDDKQMSTTSNPITKPEKEYSTFEGYYLEDKQLIDSNGNISQEWLENPKITGNDNNIALQAHWKGNIYTVNLELNGGISLVSNISVEYNGIYEINTILVDKSGYTLEGWYLDKECTTKIENNTKCTTAEEHTIYAKWIENKNIQENQINNSKEENQINNSKKDKKTNAITTALSKLPKAGIGTSAIFVCITSTLIAVFILSRYIIKNKKNNKKS